MMVWRIVKQPNGRYAEFSEVTCDFGNMNMSKPQVLTWLALTRNLSEIEALGKINLADTYVDKRWAEALNAIRREHGGERLAEVLSLGFMTVDEQALAIIQQFGGVTRPAHKQWVLDQVAQILAGDDYGDWVDDYEREGGRKVRNWETGICP